MKKLLISIILYLIGFVAVAQNPPIQLRTNGSTTPLDSNIFAGKSMRPPVFADTIQANRFRTLDSAGKIIYTYDVDGYWYRSNWPRQWKRVVDTTILATIYYVDSSIAINNFYNGFDSSTRLISGAVIWDSNFTYENNYLTYQILGKRYNAPPSNFTSNGSDTLYDRYITIVADTNGVVSVLEGIAGSPANIPAPDPASQITLAVYFIPANATQPAVVSASVIYKENIAPPEWTFDIGTSIANPNYPTNPYEGVKSTRLDSIIAAQSFSYQELGTHISDTYSYLSLKLRLDDTLPQSVGFVFTWYNGLSAVSLPITVLNGYYGYNRATTGAYQTIIVPMASFPFITNVFDKLVISAVGNSSVGVQIDNIILQTGGVNITNNNTVDTSSLSNRIDQKLNISDTLDIRIRPIAGANMEITGSYPDLTFISHKAVGAVIYPIQADSIGVDTSLIYLNENFLDTVRSLINVVNYSPDTSFLYFTHANGQIDTIPMKSGSGGSGGTGLLHVVGTNGLSNVNDSTIQLGGTLTKSDTLSTGSNTLRIITSTAFANPLNVQGTSGNIINALSTTGNAIYGQANISAGTFRLAGIGGRFLGAIGVSITSDSIGLFSGINLNDAASGATNQVGYPIVGELLYGSTNSDSAKRVMPLMKLRQRYNGLITSPGSYGSSIDFTLPPYFSSTETLTTQIISKWLNNGKVGNKVSQFQITGLSNTTVDTVFTVDGTGSTKLNKYTGSTYQSTDTTTYKPLVIDGSGNIRSSPVWIGSSGSGSSGGRFVTNGIGILVDSTSSLYTVKTDTTVILSKAAAAATYQPIGSYLLSSNFVDNETPSGTVDGSNITFTIANTPVAGTLHLLQNGVEIYAPANYSISGTTITMVTAPLTNAVLSINYRK